MQTSRQITTAFLEKILENQPKQDILLLNFTKSQILDITYKNLTELKSENEFSEINKKQFDIVIGDLPFGMPLVDLDTVSKMKGRKNWSYVLASLRTLKENGQAFFLIEPMVLFSLMAKRFLNDLSKEGFYYNSVFELPEKLLEPLTSLQPILIHFGRQNSEKLFIAEITKEFEQLLNNFTTERTTTKDLSTGVLVDREEFESFNRFRIEKEIENLSLQYNAYKKQALKEVAVEINTARDSFQEKPNSIYIPLIGNSAVVSDINSATVKHQNLLQVVLNSNKVKAEYLKLFFRSDLGKRVLEGLKNDYFVPKIDIDDVPNCLIPIPSLVEQDLLILTDNKLSELQDTINQLKKELSLNPKNANVILDKYQGIHEPLKQLSDEDKILSLIIKGENKHIEFKETFSKNIKTGQKDKEIEKSSLKNIVGFLNADGGILLVGVSDNGEVKGVEDDFFDSPDKYKLRFKDAIRDKIGLELPIEYDLFTVQGKQILKVECKAAQKPCFYEQKEFFIRVNPATEKLEREKKDYYKKERFK